MNRVWVLLSVLGIVVGLSMLGIHINEALKFTVAPATIKSFTQSVGTCRRRTGKIEECRHFDVSIEYYFPLSGQPSPSMRHTATVTTEVKRLDPKVGDRINIFVNTKDPAEVSVQLLREGWKTPLSVLVVSSLSLLMAALRRKGTTV